MIKHYTYIDLKKNSEKYDRNYDKMAKTVGTSQHKIYFEREEKLNSLGIQIRKSLGIRMKDPCPLRARTKFCFKCTGWIGFRKNLTPKLKRKNFTMIEFPVGEGEPCPYKPHKK